MPLFLNHASTSIAVSYGAAGQRNGVPATRTTTLPSFIGTVVKFGKKRFGDHPFAVAYSTFEVAREGFGVGVTQIEDPGSLDLRMNQVYRDRWYGVSFAAHVLQDLALGLSGFLADQGSNYSEDVGLASGGVLDSAGLRVGGDSITSSTGISSGGFLLVFRLGALYRINPRWQLGFMFQPPGGSPEPERQRVSSRQHDGGGHGAHVLSVRRGGPVDEPADSLRAADGL